MRLDFRGNENFILRGTNWEMSLPVWGSLPYGHYWFKARDDNDQVCLMSCVHSEGGLSFDGHFRYEGQPLRVAK